MGHAAESEFKAQMDLGTTVPYRLYERSEIQSPFTSKTDWYLSLIIKSYYQEWTL